MYSIFKHELTDKNKDDMWLFGNDNRIYRILEGTGDALEQEDIDDGYVDYIYIDIYDQMSDIVDNDIIDGGMILLKTLYKDTSVDGILRKVENFYDVKFFTED